jgi:hypothetical protein
MASHRGGPGSIPGQVMWDLWWTKWHWGRFSPNTSVSPANFHSTDCSTLIVYHPGWYNRPNIGRRTKWTQSYPTPRNKKYHVLFSHVCIGLSTDILYKLFSPWVPHRCSSDHRGCEVWSSFFDFLHSSPASVSGSDILFGNCFYKVWGSHGCEYEDSCVLECDNRVVW